MPHLLGQQSVELGEQAWSQLEREAFDIAGEEFNLGSPKQLGAILYDKLGLPGDLEDRHRPAVTPPRACWPNWPSRITRCPR
ncbi:MAG: DNA polymerase [Stutzerimonas stutzeri]